MMHRTALYLALTAALAAAVPGLASAAEAGAGVISAGVATLSGGGLTANVPTLGLGLAGRVGPAAIGMSLAGGRGDSTTLSQAEIFASVRGVTLPGAIIRPEAAVGEISAQAPGAAISTGYLMVGLLGAAALPHGVTLVAHLDGGTTFSGYTTQPSAPASAPPSSLSGGIAYRASVGLRYRLTPSAVVSVRYSERRLPISDVALVDHQAEAAIAYQF